MMTSPSRRFARGTSLIELMVAITILAVVMAGVTKVVADLYRTQRVRTLGAKLQGGGRDALGRVEHQLRAASLGAPLGVIWYESGLNVIRRPAVQIYDNVAGGGIIPVKPRSDALLVVIASGQGGEAATVGVSYSSTNTLQVTSAAPFAAGIPVLIGPYGSAAWASVNAIDAGPPITMRLNGSSNIYPGGKMDQGSMIRPVRSFLYYVNGSDQLIEQELLVPLPPSDLAQAGEQHILGRGFENLQIDCETDNGVAFQPCPGALAAADPVAAEAEKSFGSWGTGGPRLNEGTISTLRTVTLSVTVRSERPVAGAIDEPAVALEGTVLPIGGGSGDGGYIRRAYRLPVAVRNVSLGAL